MTSSEATPVRAIAQFFDDIRVEVTGKTILIGQYIGDLLLPPNAAMFDRLSVLITLRWPRDYMPKSMSFRVEIPGQLPLTQTLPAQEKPDIGDKPLSPFAGVTAQVIVNCRFPPLRAGDNIDVWVTIDGSDIPAGRLKVSELAASLQNPSEAQESGKAFTVST